MRIVTSLLIVSSIAGIVGSAVAESSEWRSDGYVDGVYVESRDVAGSPYEELRMTATSTASVETLCNTLYPRPFDPKLEGRFKKRELLREADNERWIYEQVSVPVVSDRDYVVHLKLEQWSGRCEISFESLDQGVRPSPPGVVRIHTIRGHWSVAPTTDGKAVVRYQIFTEPGGGVPAFLARGGIRTSNVDLVKLVVTHSNQPKTSR
jgi:hypothetical protein